MRKSIVTFCYCQWHNISCLLYFEVYFNIYKFLPYDFKFRFTFVICFWYRKVKYLLYHYLARTYPSNNWSGRVFYHQSSVFTRGFLGYTAVFLFFGSINYGLQDPIIWKDRALQKKVLNHLVWIIASIKIFFKKSFRRNAYIVLHYIFIEQDETAQVV